jgi:hypothetical protein
VTNSCIVLPFLETEEPKYCEPLRDVSVVHELVRLIESTLASERSANHEPCVIRQRELSSVRKSCVNSVVPEQDLESNAHGDGVDQLAECVDPAQRQGFDSCRDSFLTFT